MVKVLDAKSEKGGSETIFESIGETFEKRIGESGPGIDCERARVTKAFLSAKVQRLHKFHSSKKHESENKMGRVSVMVAVGVSLITF